MSDDDTAAELARYLAFAEMVQRVLPVDEEAERKWDAAMARWRAKQPPGRKLKRRTP